MFASLSPMAFSHTEFELHWIRIYRERTSSIFSFIVWRLCDLGLIDYCFLLLLLSFKGQSLHSLRHGDQCREDQADDKQHLWHQHRDRSKWTEAWDCHKLQAPGFSYNWWGFQASDTPLDSTDNSSIDKVETSLEWQEYFCQFQDTTDALPCHTLVPVCLWIMDPQSRAPEKNTCHWNEVLPQDTTHFIQRPCY